MDTSNRTDGEPMVESTVREESGASQVGPFDYCLVGFKRDRLNLDRPQKLGPLDVGLIYFRRHLAQRARDYQRLGAARGALKPLPRRVTDQPRREEVEAR